MVFIQHAPISLYDNEAILLQLINVDWFHWDTINEPNSYTGSCYIFRNAEHKEAVHRLHVACSNALVENKNW